MKKGKVFGNFKKVIVTIVCMVVLLFSMPIKSSAGIQADFIGLLLHIPDAVMWVGNKYIAEDTIVTDVKINLKEWDGKGKLYNFAVTPYEIFISGCYDELQDSSGNTMYYTKLGLFDANFFTDKTITSNTLVSSNILSRSVGSVYKALRNFCIIVMLLVLVYIGIKIMMSSTAKDESKYKQMLIDWVVGICLLFSMHYIMSFFMTANQAVVKMLRNDSGDTYYVGISEIKAAGVISAIEGDSGWYDTLVGTKTIAHIMDNQAKGTIKAAYAFTNPGAAFLYYATVGHSEDVQSIKELEFFANKVVIKNSQKDDDTFYVEQNGHVNINGQATTHGGNVDYSQWGDNGDLYLSATIYHSDHAKYANKAIYKANLVEFARTMSSFTEDDTDKVFLYTSNSLGGKSLKAQGTEEDENTISLAWGILYLALVIETIMFVIIYFKRVFQLAMYTMIAPFVALMYPLDKIGDGKAQSFNAWLKDYMFTILIQPLHLLLYTIFIGAARELFSHNIIYAAILYGFMIPAEKYLKKIFGFEKSSSGGGSALAGAAGGLLAMRGFDKLTGLGPHGKSGSGSGGDSGSKTKLRRDKISDRVNLGNGGAAGGAGGGTAGGGGGAPTSSGPLGALRRGLGAAAGGAGNAVGNAAAGNGRVPSASSPSNDRRGSAIGNLVKRKINRAVTGGRYGNLKDISGYGRARALAGGIGKNALKWAGRAAGMSGFGAAGLMVGAATAMATGDASKIAQGLGAGVVGGWKRGGDIANWGSDKVLNLTDDIALAAAENNEGFRHKLMADEGIEAFVRENGFDPNEKERATIEAVSGFKDLKGDKDNINLVAKAMDHYTSQGYNQDEAIYYALDDLKAKDTYDLDSQKGMDDYANHHRERFEEQAEAQVDENAIRSSYNSISDAEINKMRREQNQAARDEYRNKIAESNQKYNKMIKDAATQAEKDQAAKLKENAKNNLLEEYRNKERATRDNNEYRRQLADQAVQQAREEKVNELVNQHIANIRDWK